MQNNTKNELNAVYVNIINKLYENSVPVEEYQINDDVIAVIEDMLYEIRTCNARLGIFTSIAEGLANGYSKFLEGLGLKKGPAQVNWVKEIISTPSKGWVLGKATAFGVNFIKGFTVTWFDILMNNKQSKTCVTATAWKWKTALLMALSGL